MSILLLSCIREIRNGKGLLIRAGACIPDGAPGSARPGEQIRPAKSRAAGEHRGAVPSSASGYFKLSSASVYLPGQNCLFLAHLPSCACNAFGGCNTR